MGSSLLSVDTLGDMTPIEIILFVQVAKSTIVQDCFSEVGQGTLTDWKGSVRLTS